MAHANLFLRARPIGGMRRIEGEEEADKMSGAEREWRTAIERHPMPPQGVIECAAALLLTTSRCPESRQRTVGSPRIRQCRAVR